MLLWSSITSMPRLLISPLLLSSWSEWPEVTNALIIRPMFLRHTCFRLVRRWTRTHTHLCALRVEVGRNDQSRRSTSSHILADAASCCSTEGSCNHHATLMILICLIPRVFWIQPTDFTSFHVPRCCQPSKVRPKMTAGSQPGQQGLHDSLKPDLGLVRHTAHTAGRRGVA